ncbi:hypothetical protein C8J57DRAFT_1256369 [Mycena rebaudengoi]|nr:hypothetical protein C8J57DRAFT_1256369 [Mycena rebaudengoi]
MPNLFVSIYINQKHLTYGWILFIGGGATKKKNIDQDNIQSRGVKLHLLCNTLWILGEFSKFAIKKLEWRGRAPSAVHRQTWRGAPPGHGRAVARWHADRRMHNLLVMVVVVEDRGSAPEKVYAIIDLVRRGWGKRKHGKSYIVQRNIWGRILERAEERGYVVVSTGNALVGCGREPSGRWICTKDGLFKLDIDLSLLSSTRNNAGGERLRQQILGMVRIGFLTGILRRF